MPHLTFQYAWALSSGAYLGWSTLVNAARSRRSASKRLLSSSSQSADWLMLARSKFWKTIVGLLVCVAWLVS